MEWIRYVGICKNKNFIDYIGEDNYAFLLETMKRNMEIIYRTGDNQYRCIIMGVKPCYDPRETIQNFIDIISCYVARGNRILLLKSVIDDNYDKTAVCKLHNLRDLHDDDIVVKALKSHLKL